MCNFTSFALLTNSTNLWKWNSFRIVVLKFDLEICGPILDIHIDTCAFQILENRFLKQKE